MEYITLLAVLVILVVLELFYFRIADRFNIIDKPNQRSSHTAVTLRGGGIIFLLGAWIYSLFYGFQYPLFLTGLTLIAGISFADDIHPIKNKYRLVVQFASMALLFAEWGLLTAELWWIVPIALVVCVGIINAYNFMDGINGITGGFSLAVLIPLLYVNQELAFVDENLLVIAIMSVLVFLFFNFRKKAKCFAGDVGAVGIAFMVMFALGSLILQTGDLTYIIFLTMYGVDAVLTIVHRIMLKENIGEAHRKHAYQLMANELKMDHRLVTLIYTFLQLVVSFGLILLPMNHWMYALMVLLLLSVAYVLFKKKYYHLHEEYLQSKQ